ncbi:MAG: hypothetical protein L0Z62_27575 [Gemmataceae bacterium]|nr:hypothetical protein [Gemmataceae bacterium]
MCDPRTERVNGTEAPPEWDARDIGERPEGRPAVDVVRWPGPRQPALVKDLQRWLDLCG